MNDPKDDLWLEEYLQFLDDLREGASVNMFSAAPYLEIAFDLDRYYAENVLKYWMRTYGERHQK